MAKDSIPQKNDVKGINFKASINAGFYLNRIMMCHKNNGSCSTNGCFTLISSISHSLICSSDIVQPFVSCENPGVGRPSLTNLLRNCAFL